MDKRTRRTEEQRIVELEGQIASLKARAEAKQVMKDPAVKHITAAVRFLDKALAQSDDNATRTALQDARSTLSACLSLGGGSTLSNRADAFASRGSAPKRAARMGGSVDSDALYAYVTSHPGHRGEQIAAALSTDVTTMRPVMRRLIEERKVRTQGQRRGMSYFRV